MPPLLHSSPSLSLPHALFWCFNLNIPSLPKTLISFSSPPLPSHSLKPPSFSSSSSPHPIINATISPSTNHQLGLVHLNLFQDFGLSDKETRSLYLKNSALSLASPQSLRSRLLSLQSLGLVPFAISRLLSRRPDLLTCPELPPFLRYARRHLTALDPSKLERLLASADPLSLPSLPDKIQLLSHRGVPRDKLSHVLNSINLRIFCRRSPQEIDAILEFFAGYDVAFLVRRPALLNLDLHTQIVPRIGFFQDLGGGEEDIKALLRKFPPMLSYTVEHLENHGEFWRGIGFRDHEIFKILLVYPGVVSVSKERKLQPRLGFLKDCGLSSNELFRFLTKAPLFLSLSFEENLSKKLGFLVKLGYKYRTRELAFAMGAVTRTSTENMQMVIGVFLDYGFSLDDVFAMSKRHPQVLQYNYASLERKMEYLIGEMGRDIGELLSFPAFLGYKLEERIKQRYEVKKDIRGRGLSLNKLLSVSAKTFLKESSSSAEVEFELHEANRA